MGQDMSKKLSEVPGLVMASETFLQLLLTTKSPQKDVDQTASAGEKQAAA